MVSFYLFQIKMTFGPWMGIIYIFARIFTVDFSSIPQLLVQILTLIYSL